MPENLNPRIINSWGVANEGNTVIRRLKSYPGPAGRPGDSAMCCDRARWLGEMCLDCIQESKPVPVGSLGFRLVAAPGLVPGYHAC